MIRTLSVGLNARRALRLRIVMYLKTISNHYQSARVSRVDVQAAISSVQVSRPDLLESITPTRFLAESKAP